MKKIFLAHKLINAKKELVIFLKSIEFSELTRSQLLALRGVRADKGLLEGILLTRLQEHNEIHFREQRYPFLGRQSAHYHPEVEKPAGDRGAADQQKHLRSAEAVHRRQPEELQPALYGKIQGKDSHPAIRGLKAQSVNYSNHVFITITIEISFIFGYTNDTFPPIFRDGARGGSHRLCCLIRGIS
jgi:hypothetical protein